MENNFWNLIKDGTDINPNVLHDYENVTYDITLAMTTTAVTKRWMDYERSKDEVPYDINDLSNKSIFEDEVIILAQTAGTVAQITRLDIEGTTSPNQITNLTFSSNFRMAVTQPLGGSFLRNIYKSATLLDIKNHYSHPYFLQVYLKGRAKDGSAPVQEIPGTKRVYAIYISNITYRVELGAVLFDITAIRATDLGKADDHMLVQDMDITEPIPSFKEFLRIFKEKLHEQERHYLGQSKLILDQYDFEVIGPWKGGNTNEKDKNRADQFLDSPIQDDINATQLQNMGTDTGTVTFSINKNTSIREILEKIISRNVFAQKEITGIRDNLHKAFSTQNWEDVNLGKLLPMMTCHHELLRYDPLRRDYAKKFTWRIHLADYNTVSSAVRDELTPSEEYSKLRAETMRTKKHIVKRYDYYNTGMNLDVLNFDINFNFQYVYGLDTVVGLYNRYGDALSTKTSAEFDSSQKFQQLAKQGAINQAYQSSGAKTGSSDFKTLTLRRQTLELVQEAYTNFEVEADSNSLEAYNQLVESYNEDIKNYDRSNLNPNENTMIDNLSSIDSKSYLGNQVVNTYADAGQEFRKVGKTSWMSMDQTLAEKIEDKRYITAAQINGTQFPVQFYERYFQPETEGITEVGAGSEFQTVIRNAKVGSAEMVKAELDIIGDTYWLDKPEQSAKMDDPEAFNPKRENVVLFVSRVGSEKLKSASEGAMGDSPEAMRQQSDEFITALYRVWKIDHTFENGQFTTKLHMVRDTITDLGLVMGDPIPESEEKPVIDNSQSMKTKIEERTNVENSDGSVTSQKDMTGDISKLSDREAIEYADANLVGKEVSKFTEAEYNLVARDNVMARYSEDENGLLSIASSDKDLFKGLK